MNASTGKTVVGVFEQVSDAENAVNQLRLLGFQESQIGVTGRDWRDTTTTHETNESYAAEGATAGLVGGAGVGLLWGLGVVAGTMPIIGPAIAAGTLAAIASSAAAGAAAAGLGGMLIGMGIPREEAEYYESELSEGRILVTVDPDGREEAVRQVFRNHNAFDYSTRLDSNRMATSHTTI